MLNAACRQSVRVKRDVLALLLQMVKGLFKVQHLLLVPLANERLHWWLMVRRTGSSPITFRRILAFLVLLHKFIDLAFSGTFLSLTTAFALSTTVVLWPLFLLGIWSLAILGSSTHVQRLPIGIFLGMTICLVMTFATTTEASIILFFLILVLSCWTAPAAWVLLSLLAFPFSLFPTIQSTAHVVRIGVSRNLCPNSGTGFIPQSCGFQVYILIGFGMKHHIVTSWTS